MRHPNYVTTFAIATFSSDSAKIRCSSTEEDISSPRQGSSEKRLSQSTELSTGLYGIDQCHRDGYDSTETFSIGYIMLFNGASEQMPRATNATGRFEIEELHETISLVIATVRQYMYIRS